MYASDFVEKYYQEKSVRKWDKQERGGKETKNVILSRQCST